MTTATGLLGLLALSLLLPTLCVSQGAAIYSPAASSAPPGECSSSGEEGRVLCAAAREKDASIAQVIAEDETSRLEPEPPSAENAGDVWTAAYNQWIKGDPTSLRKGVDRAIHEAKKRFGIAGAVEGHPEGQKERAPLPDAEDDELVVVTRAVHTLGQGGVDEKVLSDAVEMVDVLCASGDNGRQVAAAGGVTHLLRLAGEGGKGISVAAVKALASCAQNNPPVVERAVAEGAVAALVDAAKGGKDVPMMAAALRALVAVAENGDARTALAGMRVDIVLVVAAAVEMGEEGREEKRCVVRGFALAETVLLGDGEWKQAFGEEVQKSAERALRSTDVDVREGAARVLALLR